MLGIVTDCDLVLQATAEEISPDDATLAGVMTEGLVTIRRSADAHAAIEAMRANGVRPSNGASASKRSPKCAASARLLSIFASRLSAP